MGRGALLVLAATALAGVSVAWFARSGAWRRGRLWIVALAVVATFALLSRRVGWAELAILAVVTLLPALLIPVQRSRRP
jgi:hypothetical protein